MTPQQFIRGLGWLAAGWFDFWAETIAPTRSVAKAYLGAQLAEAEESVEVWEPASESEWLGGDPARWDEYNVVPAASAGSGTGPDGVSDPPTPPPSGHLAAWLVPAVCDVLAEHEPATFEDLTWVSCADDVRANHYQVFRDQQAWREHVASLITARVAEVLPHYPQM